MSRYRYNGQAVRAMENAGFTNVRVTGRNLIFPEVAGGCDRNDAVAIHVVAVNPRGATVHATVCEGLWKGATVRY